MTPPSRRRLLERVATAAAAPAVAAVAGTAAGRGSTDVTWKNTYGGPDYQCHGLVETDGGVLVVGRTGGSRPDTPWLAEVGPDGDRQWSTTVDAPGFARAVGAVPVDGGYTVLLGTDERRPLHLVGLADDGTERWRHHLDTTGHLGVRALRRTGDGYLLGGFRGNPRRVDADLDAWLRATDDDGETRWERTYDASAVGAIVARDGGYVLAGSADDDAWLQAVASDGSPGWGHTYGGVGTEDAAVAVSSGAGVLYGGRTGSVRDAHRRAMLVRTAAGGTFAWRRTYDLQYVTDVVRHRGRVAFTGEPPGEDARGRYPEKPVLVVDRWGRVEDEVTVTVDSGWPVGLVPFDDGALAFGGRDFDDGIWLAKVRPDG